MIAKDLKSQQKTIKTLIIEPLLRLFFLCFLVTLYIYLCKLENFVAYLLETCCLGFSTKLSGGDTK